VQGNNKSLLFPCSVAQQGLALVSKPSVASSCRPALGRHLVHPIRSGTPPRALLESRHLHLGTWLAGQGVSVARRSKMYLAGAVFVFLLCMLVYRRLLRTDTMDEFLRGTPWLVQTLVRPATVFYTFLGTLLVRDCVKFWDEEVVQSLLLANCSGLPPMLTKEAKIPFVIFPWLRWLALLCPIPIVCTFIVTLRHTWIHMTQGTRTGRYVCTAQHDLAMQVIALPVVFGMMAMKSVVRLCRLMTGLGWQKLLRQTGGGSLPPSVQKDDWTRLVEGAMETYKSNYELADLYEGWALW
jgi:hypothetical protein